MLKQKQIAKQTIIMALIKCEECGHMISDRAEACPNCGCPVSTSAMSGTRETTPMARQKKKKMKTFLWVAGIIVAFYIIVIIATLASESSGSSASGSSIKHKLQTATTIEEARELIDGTVWHYTKNTSDPDDQIGFWMKVEFHGDTYTHYRADPSDGKWEKVREGTYEIVEERYSNTGEKYIAVKWDGSETLLPLQISLSLETFRFAATTKELSLPSPDYIYGNIYRTPKPAQTRYGYMELGDYEWE